MKKEIEACLRASFETDLDMFLDSHRFTRRKDSLIYWRKLPEAVQQINVFIEIHPKDQPNAAAVVYPFLDVSMDAVNEVVIEMTGGDEALVGDPKSTLHQPIALTSGNHGLGARWPIFQPDSVPGVVGELKSFLEQWTLPFLDLYSTPGGICTTYDRGDPRVSNVLAQKLRVAAAMVLCGRAKEALGVMDRYFGRPGSRNRYQLVFNHLGKLTE